MLRQSSVKRPWRWRAGGLYALLLASAMAWSQWQPIPPAELLSALQRGGLVVVMRHASAPRVVPLAALANPDNRMLERQLDEAGRASASALGEALRALRIPVGKVLSSPTYRARETIQRAALPKPSLYDELGDGGRSMHGVTPQQGEWLNRQVAQFPVGTNTFIVTHLPNISAAFPQQSGELADGEALVFGPDGKGGATLLARIRIDDWSGLGN